MLQNYVADHIAELTTYGAVPPDVTTSGTANVECIVDPVVERQSKRMFQSQPSITSGHFAGWTVPILINPQLTTPVIVSGEINWTHDQVDAQLYTAVVWRLQTDTALSATDQISLVDNANLTFWYPPSDRFVQDNGTNGRFFLSSKFRARVESDRGDFDYVYVGAGVMLRIGAVAGPLNGIVDIQVRGNEEFQPIFDPLK